MQSSTRPQTPLPVAAANSDALDAAVAAPLRGSAAMARDQYRHPAATLRFFAIDANSRVLEIEPGGGWYTDILAPALSQHGKLFEAEYAGPGPQAAAAEQRNRAAFERRLAGMPGTYGHVTVGTLSGGQFIGFNANATMDRVVTFRNIHNWIKDGQIDANLRAFYSALKPGGLLGVEEHRAAPGSSLQQMISSGYVTEAYVIEHARAAGFTLLRRSEVNANPLDTRQHPNGVWSLPPTYAGGNQDRAEFAAIGESDRMTLVFAKP